ncbi:MAG: response regulator [Bacteroidales bacterium]|nr:response regulator [Bacteroidales bacterium]
MLRTLIIDDEAHSRDTLRKLLELNCPQIFVAGEAASVAEGIKEISTLHPDLILLDINLKDGTGFDLLHALPAIDFKVIFISASDKHTIQAFRLSGVEYLLKPVNPEELIAAVTRTQNGNSKKVTCPKPQENS